MNAQEYIQSIQPDLKAGKLYLTGRLAGKSGQRLVKALTVTSDGKLTIDTGLIDYSLSVEMAKAVLKTI